VPREQWRTLIIDHHEGYWTWADYERIEAQITANSITRGNHGGAPREGAALLQGLVVCGRCGRNMHSAYSANRGASRRYYCVVRIGQVDFQPECQGMGGRQIDEAVLTAVCEILKPAALAATAKALTHADEQEGVRLTAFETAAERTRYAAERAWRQFDACEPENRLVARTLEAVWETALAEAEAAQAELDCQRQRRPTPLSDDELAWLSSAGADIRAVLDAATTTQPERKRLLRALIAKVVITIGDDTPDVIEVTIHWQGGATTSVALPRRRQGRSYRATDEDIVELIRRLACYYDDKTIAGLLNRQHRTTATGLRFTAHRVCNLRASYDIAVFTRDVAPADDDAPMVSITDAAAELGVSRASVYRWIRDGFIAAVQPTPGAPWRIRLNDELRAKVAQDAPDGWVGLDQAATILGVARQTVLHRVQRGELNAVYVRRGKREGLRIQVEADQPGLFATPDWETTQ
jgi:excisionase family DNA binding protein